MKRSGIWIGKLNSLAKNAELKSFVYKNPKMFSITFGGIFTSDYTGTSRSLFVSSNFNCLYFLKNITVDFEKLIVSCIN